MPSIFSDIAIIHIKKKKKKKKKPEKKKKNPENKSRMNRPITATMALHRQAPISFVIIHINVHIEKKKYSNLCKNIFILLQNCDISPAV